MCAKSFFALEQAGRHGTVLADGDFFDFVAGVVEFGFAVFFEGDAAFVGLDRFFERCLAAFHVADDGFKLGQGLFKAQFFQCGSASHVIITNRLQGAKV